MSQQIISDEDHDCFGKLTNQFVVMWVQPKFRQPIFTLKPIRATAYRSYYKKNFLKRRAVGIFFPGAVKEACCGRFSGAEKFASTIFLFAAETFFSQFFWQLERLRL